MKNFNYKICVVKKFHCKKCNITSIKKIHCKKFSLQQKYNITSVLKNHCKKCISVQLIDRILFKLYHFGQGG